MHVPAYGMKLTDIYASTGEHAYSEHTEAEQECEPGSGGVRRWLQPYGNYICLANREFHLKDSPIRPLTQNESPCACFITNTYFQFSGIFGPAHVEM